MSKKILLLALALYVGSALLSFGVFSTMGGTQVIPLTQDGQTEAELESEETALAQLLEIDPKAARDQVCPLNGQLYTATEQAAWAKRRPLAVMIENTVDARPQSGLIKADLIFEAVAEGGITRFMALYYCGAQVADTTLAPIRSARTYYVDWASGFNMPMYVHVGGANLAGPTDALGQLSEYGWRGQTDIDQFSLGYPTFVRDYNRVPGKEIATEHTMVTSSEKLWAVAEKRGWTNLSPARTVGKTTTPGSDWQAGYTGWTYEDDQAGKGTVANIKYGFMGGYDDFNVEWNYDLASNSYNRSEGGEVHTDLETQKQLAAKNVIVLLTTEKGPINEKKHMLYTTTGTGEALVFKNGEVIKATWSKKDRKAELQFTDSKGKALPLLRGLTWISVLSKTAEVTY